MSKICPNCHTEYDGNHVFCSACGSKLIEKENEQKPIVNLGDANAISGGLNLSDNHSVSSNTVNTSNVDSHNVITNNITQVEREKSPEELKHEREFAYREECLKVYRNGIMTSEEKRRLEDLQYRLGLDDSSAARILSEVARRTERKSASLSPVHQITFNNIKTAINSNRLDLVNRLMAQMKAMVQRYSVEEIQFTYYMLLAILHPEECIEEYKDHREDKYWQTFWSSVAYRLTGNIEKSELLASDVGDKWIDTIPQENVFILAAVNALIDKDSFTAKSLYDNIAGEHSPYLSSLATCLYSLLYEDMLSPEDLKQMRKDSLFYMENLFADVAVRKKESNAQGKGTSSKTKTETADKKSRDEKEKGEQHDASDAQSGFDVVLTSAGQGRLSVIKKIVSVFGLELNEAKKLIEGTPKTIKENVDKAEAKRIKTALEEEGADVEIKPADGAKKKQEQTKAQTAATQTTSDKGVQKQNSIEKMLSNTENFINRGDYKKAVSEIYKISTSPESDNMDDDCYNRFWSLAYACDINGYILRGNFKEAINTFAIIERCVGTIKNPEFSDYFDNSYYVGMGDLGSMYIGLPMRPDITVPEQYIDYQKGFEYLCKSSEKRGLDVEGFNLGWCYEFGLGTDVNLEEALRLYKEFRPMSDISSQSVQARIAECEEKLRAGQKSVSVSLNSIGLGGSDNGLGGLDIVFDANIRGFKGKTLTARITICDAGGNVVVSKNVNFPDIPYDDANYTQVGGTFYQEYISTMEPGYWYDQNLHIDMLDGNVNLCHEEYPFKMHRDLLDKVHRYNQVAQKGSYSRIVVFFEGNGAVLYGSPTALPVQGFGAGFKQDFHSAEINQLYIEIQSLCYKTEKKL